MSKVLMLSEFKGLAPRFAPHLAKGWALTAENCDLRTRKIRPVDGPSLQESDDNDYNSLFYYNSDWELGDDRHYLEWKIGNHDLLIYLDSGVPKKKVGSTTADLGQTRPSAPTLAESGGGALDDTYTYIITTTRSVGGHTDESGPSDSASITVSAKTIQVTAPTISDSDVTYWNIYRMSDSSAAYQFVAQVEAGTSSYLDNTLDADLDASPDTWYTSDQGNTIVFDKPTVQSATFGGLTAQIYTGMIFAWSGSTLYWSEPGYPDAWPSFYNMNFPSDIKAVIPFAGTVAVLTETGPFRVDGTHPELLQQTQAMSNEPCIAGAACKTRHGVAYLSDSGICVFDLARVTVITDGHFTEDWFTGNVAAATALLVENDDQIYLFHSAGTLVGDMRVKPWIWHTLDITATAVHRRDDDGELYYVDDDGVQKLGAGSDLAWTWRSGDLLAEHPRDKMWQSVEVQGAGAVTLFAYVDDALIASKSLTFDMDRNRCLRFPDETRGRALQLELTGTGTVTEIEITYTP